MENIFQLDMTAAAENAIGSGAGKLQSGVHKVKITGVFVGKTKAGNNEVDITFETDEGKKGVIFRQCIDKVWKSGSENIGYNKWQEFALVTGMKTGATTEVKRRMNGAEVLAVSFAEPLGKTVFLAVQLKRDVYQNQAQETYELVKTFGVEGHSVKEKMEGKEPTEKANFVVEDYETPAYKEAKAMGTLSTSGAPTQGGTENLRQPESEAAVEVDDEELF